MIRVLQTLKIDHDGIELNQLRQCPVFYLLFFCLFVRASYQSDATLCKIFPSIDKGSSFSLSPLLFPLLHQSMYIDEE